MVQHRGRHVDDGVRIPVTVWVTPAMHAQLREVAKANGMDREQVGSIIVEAARRTLAGEVKQQQAEPKRQRCRDSEIAAALGRHQAVVLHRRTEFGLPPLYDSKGRPLFTEEQDAA